MTRNQVQERVGYQIAYSEFGLRRTERATSAVRRQAWDQLGQVWYDWFKGHTKIDDSIRLQLRKQINKKIFIRVEDLMRMQVDGQVRDQAWTQIRTQL